MGQIKVAKGPREDKLDKLRRHAVRAEDIEPCHGCQLRLEPQIRGYDGQWRCVQCNAAHAEAVFAESGDAAPNPGEVAIALPVAKGEHGDSARRAMILDKYGRQAAQPSQQPLAPEKVRGETEAKRREAILRKYGVR